MNGRIYDPRLGRFMQADPFIQAASNTQSYNRYSYVFNNPLNATDPSGYISIGGILNVVKIALTVIVAMSCQACLPILAGMFGALDAAIADGNLGDVALAAASSYISAGVTSSFVAGDFSWAGLLEVAVVGGITSVLNRGKFGHGFISAGVGTLVGGSLAPIAGDTTNNVLKGIGGIVLSGTISSATGGKFANGAGSAAFSWAVRTGVENSSNNVDSAGIEYFDPKQESSPEFTYEERVKLGASLREQAGKLKGLLDSAKSGDKNALAGMREFFGEQADISVLGSHVNKIVEKSNNFRSSNFRKIFNNDRLANGRTGAYVSTDPAKSKYIFISKTVANNALTQDLSKVADYSLLHERIHQVGPNYVHSSYNRFGRSRGVTGVQMARSQASSGLNYVNPYAYQGWLERN